MENRIPSLNLYHRWAYIDEIMDRINYIPQQAVKNEKISIYLKMLRTLSCLDGISFSILESFFHAQHPDYIDDIIRFQWIHSLYDVVYSWHDLYHQFLKKDFKDNKNWNHLPLKQNNIIQINQLIHSYKQCISHWNQIHFDLIKQNIKSFADVCYDDCSIETEFIKQITQDLHLDPIKHKYAYFEPFFRGVHQMLEVMLVIIIPKVEVLHDKIKTIKFDDNDILVTENKKICFIRNELFLMQKWWGIAAQQIMLLNKMDTASYAEYRQALLGTSGGDSAQLRLAKSLFNSLHLSLPKSLYQKSLLKKAIDKTPYYARLNVLLSSIRETQATVCDFWLRHFTLTVNTIGMIKGTQGLPVEKLLSFAVMPITHNDSLLNIVGELGIDYAAYPQAKRVLIQGKEKVIGNAIYPHVKNEVEFIEEYYPEK